MAIGTVKPKKDRRCAICGEIIPAGTLCTYEYESKTYTHNGCIPPRDDDDDEDEGQA